jgi:hypothetical protein
MSELHAGWVDLPLAEWATYMWVCIYLALVLGHNRKVGKLEETIKQLEKKR